MGNPLLPDISMTGTVINYLLCFYSLWNITVPSRPSADSVSTNSTAITVTITPSADNGGSPVTYTLFYRGDAEAYRAVAVTDVSQNQTLSPLKPYTQYFVFVKATNSEGFADSQLILTHTKEAGKKDEGRAFFCKAEKC